MSGWAKPCQNYYYYFIIIIALVVMAVVLVWIKASIVNKISSSLARVYLEESKFNLPGERHIIMLTSSHCCHSFC